MLELKVKYNEDGYNFIEPVKANLEELMNDSRLENRFLLCREDDGVGDLTVYAFTDDNTNWKNIKPMKGYMVQHLPKITGVLGGLR